MHGAQCAVEERRPEGGRRYRSHGANFKDSPRSAGSLLIPDFRYATRTRGARTQRTEKTDTYMHTYTECKSERVTGTGTDNNKLGAQKSRLKKDRREAAGEKRAESGGGETEAWRRGGGRQAARG